MIHTLRILLTKLLINITHWLIEIYGHSFRFKLDQMDFKELLEVQNQCVICISVAANMKELQCYKQSICTKCEKSHKAISKNCPHCRKEDYTTREGHFIRRLVDTFYNKCKKCEELE